MPFKDIFEALREGGFHIQGARNQERAIRISIGKNTATFVSIPGPADAFGLRERFPELARKRQKKEPSQTAGESEDSEAEAGQEEQDEIDDGQE